MKRWNILSSLIILFTVLITTPAYANEQQPALNINNASIEQLEKMKGIGPSKAQAIVEYRLQNGNFDQVDDLVKVKGIGLTFLEKNRAWLSVE
jgi:competence protein ComEA